MHICSFQHMLSREESWNSWKNDSCPKYEKEIPKEPPKMPRRLDFKYLIHIIDLLKQFHTGYLYTGRFQAGP